MYLKLLDQFSCPVVDNWSTMDHVMSQWHSIFSAATFELDGEKKQKCQVFLIEIRRGRASF